MLRFVIFNSSYFPTSDIAKIKEKQINSDAKVKIKRRHPTYIDTDFNSINSEKIQNDPRFKTVLNDILKYDMSKPGKFVNYKFRPDPEKLNVYLRHYMPEKERVPSNINDHNSHYHPREPYDNHNVSIRHSKSIREHRPS